MGISSIGGKSVAAEAPVNLLVVGTMVVTAGHDLVVGVSLSDTSVSVSSVADAVGNVFRFRNAVDNTGNVRVEIWEAQGIIGTATEFVSVHLTGTCLCSAIVWEYSGVKVESFPSPQDVTSATSSGLTLSCGVATSDISSWSATIFGWVAVPFVRIPGNGERGNLRTSKPFEYHGTDVVGIALMDVAGYPAPVGGSGYLIATPIALLSDSTQWAAVSLELRSTSAGGSGGGIPNNPPYVPPPSGDLVGFSYTFTVEASAPAPSTSADVTCSYLESVCDDGTNVQGNQGY